MCWYLIYIVAVGLGIWLAGESAKYKPTSSDPHVIIGLVVLAALFQQFLGLIRHEIFKKHLCAGELDCQCRGLGEQSWVGCTFGLVRY
jgi:hypothetical protein